MIHIAINDFISCTLGLPNFSQSSKVYTLLLNFFTICFNFAHIISLNPTGKSNLPICKFQPRNLYQPYKNLRVKSSEADQEQVSLLEKKLFGAQEELTELHRRRGENAQQIIDQSNQSKEHENRIKQLQELLEASGMSSS